jgi:hypothetical protein
MFAGRRQTISGGHVGRTPARRSQAGAGIPVILLPRHPLVYCQRPLLTLTLNTQSRRVHSAPIYSFSIAHSAFSRTEHFIACSGSSPNVLYTGRDISSDQSKRSAVVGVSSLTLLATGFDPARRVQPKQPYPIFDNNDLLYLSRQ